MIKISASLLFIGLFFWPLHSLVQNYQFPYDYAPLTLDHKLGSLITLPFQEEIKSIYLNGTALTTISRPQMYLGVIGLTKKNHILINGEWKSQKNNRLTQLWTHPVQYYFKSHISLDIPTKNIKSSLRLPTSVWSKVNDTHAEQKKKEKELILNLYDEYDSAGTINCWSRPLNSKIISQFASPRKLPNGYIYNHTGVDLRARRPASILAPADGQVVYAGHMIVPGNTVMLYHGNGIYSRYMHLSQIHVKKGASIKAGTPIGLTGMTGRVEGPHLHWEVLWKGQHSDPLAFIDSFNRFCKKL